MRSKFKWILTEKRNPGDAYFSVHKPDSNHLYDAEILHDSYHDLITKLETIKSTVRVSNITFFDFVSMASGKVMHLNAETYRQLKPDHILFVFYIMPGPHPDPDGSAHTELQILESLHKRILRLENMKTSS